MNWFTSSTKLLGIGSGVVRTLLETGRVRTLRVTIWIFSCVPDVKLSLPCASKCSDSLDYKCHTVVTPFSQELGPVHHFSNQPPPRVRSCNDPRMHGARIPSFPNSKSISLFHLHLASHSAEGKEKYSGENVWRKHRETDDMNPWQLACATV